MGKLEDITTAVHYSLDTKRKQHLVRGILMSVSLLFGGLAITVMTIKMEDTKIE